MFVLIVTEKLSLNNIFVSSNSGVALTPLLFYILGDMRRHTKDSTTGFVRLWWTGYICKWFPAVVFLVFADDWLRNV